MFITIWMLCVRVHGCGGGRGVRTGAATTAYTHDSSIFASHSPRERIDGMHKSK